MVNGRDAFDFGLRIEPGQDVENVVVTVTNRMAELTGVLRDAGRHTVVSPGYVVVFPADRAYWTGNSRRVLATRPDTDGRYAFLRTLPAGDYLLVAAAISSQAAGRTRRSWQAWRRVRFACNCWATKKWCRTCGGRNLWHLQSGHTLQSGAVRPMTFRQCLRPSTLVCDCLGPCANRS